MVTREQNRSQWTTHISSRRDDCPICHGTGFVDYPVDAYLIAKYGEMARDYKFVDFCQCRRKQTVQQRTEVSGLSEAMKRQTFDTFRVDGNIQAELKKTAEGYLSALLDVKNHPFRPWMFVGGNPGSGKTHICTAVCNELLKKGTGVKYMMWQQDSRKLKALVNDYEYEDEIAPYLNVSVLYIDDLLKQRYTDVPEFTEGDIKIAFTILNSRYLQNKPTIISSEWTLDQLLRADEGVFSRVYERCREFTVHIPRETGSNFRLGGAKDAV